jgi:hypothetical protein
MATKETKKVSVSKENEPKEQKKKSKTTLFREKYPEGIGYIVNMKAVLR